MRNALKEKRKYADEWRQKRKEYQVAKRGIETLRGIVADRVALIKLYREKLWTAQEDSRRAKTRPEIRAHEMRMAAIKKDMNEIKHRLVEYDLETAEKTFLNVQRNYERSKTNYMSAEENLKAARQLFKRARSQPI